MNGDGYSDLILGEADFGAGDVGQVSIFHGSPSGLPAAPSLAMPGKVVDGHFGRLVASAGDTNADGFEDVLVASEKHVRLFKGGADGLATTPSWEVQAEPFDLAAADFDGDGMSDLVLARFSLDIYLGQILVPALTPDRVLSAPTNFRIDAVAAGGDANGDGFPDLLAGQSTLDGLVALYLGSSAGLEDEPFSIVAGGYPLGGNAGLGQFVDWAGDLDGDGDDEVLVGAPDYRGVGFNEGSILAFRGSPAGLAARPAWRWEPGRRSVGPLGRGGLGRRRRRRTPRHRSGLQRRRTLESRRRFRGTLSAAREHPPSTHEDQGESSLCSQARARRQLRSTVRSGVSVASAI